MPAPVPEFSLHLNEDQRELRDWLHGFARDVMRPAASEWDSREETPWPLIQEAAKIGLYGFEFLATCWADPTGLSLPIASEELFWGDAGIAMSILGTGLAVAAIYGSGTPEQLLEWVPLCFGDADDPKLSLNLGAVDFLKVVSGNGNPVMMFMTGKLKAKGDLGLAANIANLFDIPKG